MKRQALYACLTCTVPKSDDFKPAGFCLACTYACHDGHEIVELYTKRNFRCDCGNSRFPDSNPCQLSNDKAKDNPENRYNQNFKGVYCTCQRPYPDDEDPVEDQMIQCVICEDWYHGRHLKTRSGGLPEDQTYAEMICQICSQKHHEDFLFAYQTFCVPKPKEEEVKKEDTEVEVEKVEEKQEQCMLEKNKHLKSNPEETHALFLESEWRSNLCKCSKCLDTYERVGLSYLTSEEDTVHHYEAKAKTEGQFPFSFYLLINKTLISITVSRESFRL